MIRRRVPPVSAPHTFDGTAEPSSPSSRVDPPQDIFEGSEDMKQRSSWMVFAVASGACAAVNGVFAKLTTTELTTSIAGSLAGMLGLENGRTVFEYLVRAIFFGLNIAFNALMWVLFTRALTSHSSTTRVSILNTSANFMITAILGMLIFREKLPPLWYGGAAMLVAGNVVIGRRAGAEDEVKGEGDQGGWGLMDGTEDLDGEELVEQAEGEVGRLNIGEVVEEGVELR